MKQTVRWWVGALDDGSVEKAKQRDKCEKGNWRVVMKSYTQSCLDLTSVDLPFNSQPTFHLRLHRLSFPSSISQNVLSCASLSYKVSSFALYFLISVLQSPHLFSCLNQLKAVCNYPLHLLKEITMCRTVQRCAKMVSNWDVFFSPKTSLNLLCWDKHVAKQLLWHELGGWALTEVDSLWSCQWNAAKCPSPNSLLSWMQHSGERITNR